MLIERWTLEFSDKEVQRILDQARHPQDIAEYVPDAIRSLRSGVLESRTVGGFRVHVL